MVDLLMYMQANGKCVIDLESIPRTIIQEIIQCNEIGMIRYLHEFGIDLGANSNPYVSDAIRYSMAKILEFLLKNGYEITEGILDEKDDLTSPIRSCIKFDRVKTFEIIERYYPGLVLRQKYMDYACEDTDSSIKLITFSWRMD